MSSRLLNKNAQTCNSGLAYLAHIGGFLVGFLLDSLLRLQLKRPALILLILNAQESTQQRRTLCLQTGKTTLRKQQPKQKACALGTRCGSWQEFIKGSFLSLCCSPCLQRGAI